MLSFLGIYWNNHHHMLLTFGASRERISGETSTLALSLIPFVTGWMGENHFATLPVAFYVVLLCAARAYWLAPAFADQSRRAGLPPDASGRERLEGELSPIIYPTAIAVGVLAALDFVRALRPGGGNLAVSRPSHRARDRRPLRQLTTPAHKITAQARNFLLFSFCARVDC
ncbi:MAG: hypothetical protein M3Q46_15195 [Verrucomicrobiota bacterium]|nr:hypothetical protein [Verrucomicrobiota bacterium]